MDTLDVALREHALRHDEIKEHCPYCSLRRIAEALEMIAVAVTAKVNEREVEEVYQ